MGKYIPTYIKAYETGLVQERENFILPNDAFPVLENAYVWRERIKRKQGYQLLGRLQRTLSTVTVSLLSPFTLNLFTLFSITETNAQIVPGSIQMTIGPETYTDNGSGLLTGAPSGFALINYSTGVIDIHTAQGPGNPVTITLSYNPNLPVMGIPNRELDNVNNEQMIVFDTIYAYIFTAGAFQEFIPGTTWTGTDFNFFWGTNYWVGDGNLKIFWVTNFSGPTGDPIRYTNGTNWINFSPQINAAGDVLAQSLALLPFRSRLLAFNTYEGPNLAGSIQNPQRIRWAAIGNPFTTPSAIVTNVNADAWRDDIRGQGGFLDIPTSESITAVGFVRDNLVIYCERSTWQLRYTGRSIAPFQIEKVNSELGAESTFSAVQFDTSLVGIGDKGIVECDSFQSRRIDIKIPDLVFHFTNDAHGPQRVQGIRDFPNRLAYWIYPYQSDNLFSSIYPNRRLVYNYENDSWAIFTDSLTCLGNYQSNTGLRWQDAKRTWASANVTWQTRPSLFPLIVGGNQQGFVEILDQDVASDVSLYIKNITGNSPNVTTLTIPTHNLQDNQVIQISNISSLDPFVDLNDQIFSVSIIDSNTVSIFSYDPSTKEFDNPNVHASGTYISNGMVKIRDNFSIVSKKFNYLDQGSNVQLGFIDILINNTSNGAISLNIYQDYNDSEPSNVFPQNNIQGTMTPDTFFNTTVSTSVPVPRGSTKNWQRVFCPSRGAFLTIEWTLSNEQMISEAQTSDVQIDAQILWMREAGKLLPAGV